MHHKARLVGCGFVIVLAACEQREAAPRGEPANPVTRKEPWSAPPGTPVSAAPSSVSWETITADWPAKARGAAREIVGKYGPPDELSRSFLVWNKREPWKRIIAAREEVAHDWPTPHVDTVEQFIDFKVPPEMFDELAKFDGSVVVERTKGEISARCGGEPANLLALNLANEIITGKKTVNQARELYVQAMQRKEKGETHEYLVKLKFEVPTSGTADRDLPAAPGTTSELQRTEPSERGGSSAITDPAKTGARGVPATSPASESRELPRPDEPTRKAPATAPAPR